MGRGNDCCKAIRYSAKPVATTAGTLLRSSRYIDDKPKEDIMPVFVVPLLVGLPIVVGGGWVIYKVVAG